MEGKKYSFISTNPKFKSTLFKSPKQKTDKFVTPCFQKL